MAPPPHFVHHPVCRAELDAVLYGIAPDIRGFILDQFPPEDPCATDHVTDEWALLLLTGGLADWWEPATNQIVHPSSLVPHAARWGPDLARVGTDVHIHHLCRDCMLGVIGGFVDRVYERLVYLWPAPYGYCADRFSAPMVSSWVGAAVAMWWDGPGARWPQTFPAYHTGDFQQRQPVA